MIDSNLQTEIDKELTRYETLTNEIEKMQEQIDKRLKEYEELLNSYLTALQIVQPKMDSWREPRRDKFRKLCQRLSQKWSNTRSAIFSDPVLEQDEQLFMAVIRIHYKKPSDQEIFQRKRTKLIQQEIAKIHY